MYFSWYHKLEITSSLKVDFVIFHYWDLLKNSWLLFWIIIKNMKRVVEYLLREACKKAKALSLYCVVLYF